MSLSVQTHAVRFGINLSLKDGKSKQLAGNATALGGLTSEVAAYGAATSAGAANPLLYAIPGFLVWIAGSILRARGEAQAAKEKQDAEKPGDTPVQHPPKA